MSNKMVIGIAIIFVIFHITTSYEIDTRSTEYDKWESIRTVANSINEFSTDLYKVISKNVFENNIVCSPLSVAMVLMMTAYGASGKTLGEINKVLHIGADENLQKNGIHSLLDQFNAMKEVELRLANNIFIRSGVELKSEFQTMTDTIFRSGIKHLNFTDPMVASAEINNWCEKQTNSRIKEIVKPDDFDDRTALVLINAVYFKGKWAKQFNQNHTQLRNFHRADNTTKQVPMMYDNGKYRYGDLPDISARFIEVPYKSTGSNDAVSMFIILPNNVDGLKKVEENFHKVNLTQLLMGEKHEVDLFMPKFKIESEIDLSGSLPELGLVEIFGNNANFTRMTNQLPLKVNKIMQKAFIEVNEEGSEAAAVTEIELENRFDFDDGIQQTFFHIDRPFLIFIASKNVILFNAHVVDPGH